ncbi:DUF1173 domain-containing protein [Vibrio sp. R78045]|uniref:DUF1173 domain-containing protein n=1 Tax=Vibrio sp. R78045 TaxID=3093868 RepID=UPI0036F2E7C7
MNIYIVDKSSPFDKSHPISNPSILLEKNRRSAESQSFLAQIRESKQELRCACVPDKPARMFIRFCHDYYTLVNHAAEGVHSDSCELFSEVHGFSERTSNSTSHVDDEDSTVEHFILHKNVNDDENAPKKVVSNTPRASTGKRENSIDKLVRYLTKASFENCYYKGKKQSTMQALNHLIKPSRDIRFGNTNLGQWIFYGEKGYRFAITSLSRAVKNNNWNGAGRPHALIFLVASQLETTDDCVIADGVKYSVNKIYRTGRKTKAPVLIVLSLAVNPLTKEFEVYNAYIKPVLSTSHLMPVDSHLERVVAQGLIDRIESASDSFRWSLQKPLFSKADRSNSVSVLPDFILRSKNKNKVVNYVEVIEVMGCLDDPEYVKRKARLTPMMLEAWRANRLVQVDPTDPDDLESFFLEHDNL